LLQALHAHLPCTTLLNSEKCALLEEREQSDDTWLSTTRRSWMCLMKTDDITRVSSSSNYHRARKRVTATSDAQRIYSYDASCSSSSSHVWPVRAGRDWWVIAHHESVGQNVASQFFSELHVFENCAFKSLSMRTNHFFWDNVIAVPWDRAITLSQKNDLCCFGCVTWSLLHGIVNW